MILSYKTRKNDLHFFHLLQFVLLHSTYYVIKVVNMENTGIKPFNYNVLPQAG